MYTPSVSSLSSDDALDAEIRERGLWPGSQAATHDQQQQAPTRVHLGSADSIDNVDDDYDEKNRIADDPIDDLFPQTFAVHHRRPYEKQEDIGGGSSNDTSHTTTASLFPDSTSDEHASKLAHTTFSSSPFSADDSHSDNLDQFVLEYPRRPSDYDYPRSIPSSLGTFVIDDTAPGVDGNYTIEESMAYHPPKKHYTELKRTLKTRHIQMIAVGGVLGNGLFIGSGKVLGNSGPLGMLLGFLITGMVVFSVMVSFGEMVALIPIAGGISAFGSRFVDDGLGFALGFCYWFSLAVAIPTQVSSAAILLTYFAPFDPWKLAPAVMVVCFLFVIIFINSMRVQIYGEIEYVFGQIKLSLLLGLIIFMFTLNRGHISPETGKTTVFPVNFANWDASRGDMYGPFRPYFEVTEDDHIEGSTGRFLMVWTAVVQSVYSFSGTELVALTAGEAKHPRRALPRATLRIFFRIFTLYMLGVFAVGLNVAAGNQSLPGFFMPWSKYSTQKVSWTMTTTSDGNCQVGSISMQGYSSSNSSPWIIAMQNAGLCVGASVVTCLFVFCAWSAGNSYLYASSRTLYAMAIQGKAPRYFGLCTKGGLPYVSVVFTFAIAMTVFLVSFPNSTTITVYYWIRKLTSIPGTLVWAGICLSYIRFYYGLKLRPDIVQRDMKAYPYRSPFQPYTAYFGLIGCILLVIFNDMTIFVKFEWQYFIASYVSLLLFLICFVGYKLWRRTRLVPLARMDLDLGRREMDLYEAETAAEMRMMEKGILGKGKRTWRWIKAIVI